MKHNTSLFLSLGISAVLIAAGIGFLHAHNAGMWVGNSGWGMGYNHMMGGGAIMMIFWIVLVVALVLLITGGIKNRIFMSDTTTRQDSVSSLEILRQRYAKGEIDKMEYEEKKKDLTR
ncbi:MAG: SHOCT domain-containing protein [Pseudomonadota bacterium]